jgi:hypothetical protein
MAGRSVNELLAPEVILREVSRIKLPGTTLSDIFGWGLAQRNPDNMTGNVIDYDLRDGRYDVFNRSREIATATVPGTQNVNIKPQKVGVVRFTVPRSAERIPLLHEQLVNRRALGQAVNQVDAMGANYIDRQKQYMMMRVANMIEFQTAAMLRGSYSFDQEGDELRQLFTGGQDTIDFLIPANNKNQLNGIIGTSWATTSTDIPGDVMAINQAANDLTGMGIEHAVLNSNTWQYVINNLKIQAQAGTSNTPFSSYTKTGPGQFTASLRAIPWIQWHVVDYSLSIWNGNTAFSDVRLIADDQVTFFPEPDSSWVQYLNGGEMVTEGPRGTAAFRNGFYAYGYESWDPSGWNLCTVHNGIPCLYVPGAIFNADVTP